MKETLRLTDKILFILLIPIFIIAELSIASYKWIKYLFPAFISNLFSMFGVYMGNGIFVSLLMFFAVFGSVVCPINQLTYFHAYVPVRNLNDNIKSFGKSQNKKNRRKR